MKPTNFIGRFLAVVLTVFATFFRNTYERCKATRLVPLSVRMLFLRAALRLSPICGGATQANAQIGAGTQVFFWDDLISSPPAYVELGKYRQLTNILGAEIPEVDSTTLDSTEQEFIPGLPIGMEFSVVTTFTAAALANFEAIKAANENIDMKVVVPSPTNQTRYFTATPRGFNSGTTAPSTLKEITGNFRRTGATSTVDPHA